MKLASFLLDGQAYAGALTERGLAVFDLPAGTGLGELIRRGTALDAFQTLAERAARVVDPASVQWLAPMAEPPKTICIGLNYADHTKESPYEQPAYPTVFLRVWTALTAHQAIIRRPLCSETLDYEAEMVVVLAKGGRHIAREQALDYVFGYAVGNEVSVREYQFKSPQWTVGKNFDGTGAWGPCIVTADELPPGGAGLQIEARLNGQTVQSANTRDMIYDVAHIISTLSEAMTLQAGDVIFSGTPAGVGLGRTPPLWMKHGDEIEIEIECIGLLRNRIEDEQR